MAGEWLSLPFSEAVVVNPSVRLERGRTYPFVDMASVTAGTRCAHASEQRAFSGGGSRFQHGDTLMARITPCLENGKIARYCGPDQTNTGHGSTEFIVIRGRSGVTTSAFAYYLTLSEEVRGYAIGQMTGTSGRQRVPTDSLAHLFVRIPPLPEQRAIAHILGRLDDKIELNRRISATLEAMARALFKSWFLDFDPVRDRAEGRDTGLPEYLASLFPDRLVESELGEIPEGWEVVALPTLIRINPSYPLRKDEVAPYLDMANMPTTGHAPDQVIKRPFGSGMRFVNGDTLLARITPCLENGKTAFVDFLSHGEVGWGSTEYIVLQPRQPAPAEFGYLLARDNRFREFAIQHMTGTSGRQRVPASALKHYELASPRDGAVFTAFGKFIKPMFERSTMAVKESRALSAMRDALLPKFISGEFRVHDAEAFLEQVLP